MLWLLLLPRERRYLLTFCRRKGYAQGRQHLPLISRGLRQFRHGCFLVDLVLQQAQSAPCPQPIQLCKELSVIPSVTSFTLSNQPTWLLDLPDPVSSTRVTCR